MAVQKPCQLEAIDTLHTIKDTDHFSGFVALQMTDHMPAQPLRMKRGELGQRLLHTVLPELRHPQTKGHFHHLHRFRLRHGYECNLIRLATCTLCRLRYTGAYLGNISGE